MSVSLPKSPPLFNAEGPIATFGLLAIIIAVYFCEVLCSGFFSSFQPLSPRTLLAMGAMNGLLIDRYHQWYRLLTAVFLHASSSHLLFNSLALCSAGRFLEKTIGRSWLVAYFFVGGFSGSLMSWALNNPATISVGASGAIMALFAGFFVCSYRFPKGPQRAALRYSAIQVFILSLIPLIPVANIRIDVANHVGGILGGTIFGFILLKCWPINAPAPRHEKYAQAIIIVGCAATLFGLFFVVEHYQSPTRALTLMPDSAIPQDSEQRRQASTDMVKRYPEDARAHYFSAETHLWQHNIYDAQNELYIALEKVNANPSLYNPKLPNIIRLTLANVLLQAGQPEEAKKVVSPVCNAKKSNLPDGNITDIMVSKHLCE